MAGSPFCSCFTYMFSWKGAACVLFRGRWSALASCSPPQPRLDTLDAHCIPTGFSSIASPSSSSRPVDQTANNPVLVLWCTCIYFSLVTCSFALFVLQSIAVDYREYQWSFYFLLLFAREFISFVRASVGASTFVASKHITIVSGSQRVSDFRKSHLQLLVHPFPWNSCLQCS